MEGISTFHKSFPKLLRHLVGVLCHLIEEVVLEQLLKLDSQQPALCQHCASLLDHKAEVRFQVRGADDERFSEQCPVLGASDIKYVHKVRDTARARSFTELGQGSAHPCAVEEEIQPVLAAETGEGFQFCF